MLLVAVSRIVSYCMNMKREKRTQVIKKKKKRLVKFGYYAIESQNVYVQMHVNTVSPFKTLTMLPYRNHSSELRELKFSVETKIYTFLNRKTI